MCSYTISVVYICPIISCLKGFALLYHIPLSWAIQRTLKCLKRLRVLIPVCKQIRFLFLSIKHSERHDRCKKTFNTFLFSFPAYKKAFRLKRLLLQFNKLSVLHQFTHSKSALRFARDIKDTSQHMTGVKISRILPCSVNCGILTHDLKKVHNMHTANNLTVSWPITNINAC